MADRRTNTLLGEWVHSHEDDTDSEMVFRPASYSFPPARGRSSFALCPDGTYVESSPGPIDLPEQTRGTWSLEGDHLVLAADGGRSGHDWEILSSDRDRLMVKK